MSNISVYVLYSGSAQCNLFIGEPTIQLDSRDRGYETDFITFVKTKTKYLPTLSEKNSHWGYIRGTTYLDQEEVDAEGREASGQLDILVLRVNL